MRGPDWNAIKCFVTVADCGSLTAAAGRLSISVGAVSRRIDQLEAGLALKLLRRGPQGIDLTEAGAKLFAVAAMGAERFGVFEKAAEALRHPERKAPIRISATEPLVAQVLAPRLGRLTGADGKIRVVLSVSNENVSLRAGDADLAIRMAKPDSESIVARRLPAIALGLFCSERYLAGRDPAILDLREERLLWFDSAYGEIPENRWLLDRSLEHRVFMRSGSSEALRQAALAGAGIAPVARNLAAAINLIEVSADALPERRPWLLFHRDLRRDPDHRQVRRWIVDACEDVFSRAG